MSHVSPHFGSPVPHRDNVVYLNDEVRARLALRHISNNKLKMLWVGQCYSSNTKCDQLFVPVRGAYLAFEDIQAEMERRGLDTTTKTME